jgi:mannosyltransferase
VTQTTGRDPERAGHSQVDDARAAAQPGRSGSARPASSARPAPATLIPWPARMSRTARLADRAGLSPRISETGRIGRTGRFLDALIRRPYAAELLVALISVVVFSWRVWRPSPWWDEAITRDVTSRSASQILDLSEHVDLVHTTYYLIVHAILGSSTTITPIRMLSVVAASLTAVLLVRLGHELDSPRVGLVAALLWTTAPLVTRYAQEARPYAMVALAATAATLALVRVCRRPWLRARWAVYAATVIALGLLNVLALLLLVVHLSYVLATSAATVRRRWYLVGGSALLLLTPMLYASSRQSEQVSWLPRPRFSQLAGFLQAEFAVGGVVVALLVIAIMGIGRGTHRPALALGLSWALIPPVLLWAISQSHPLFDWRYVFYTVPGTALALASLATLLRLRWLVVAILVLAIGGVHMQEVYRFTARGHGENIRGASEVIAEGARPGDAVLFLPASRRVVKLGYPDDFKGVDDVALEATGEQSATLWGVEEPAGDLAAALRKRTRVWVVTGAPRLGEIEADPAEQEKERLLYGGYRLTGVTDKGGYQIRLYERSGAASLPGPVVTSGTSS